MNAIRILIRTALVVAGLATLLALGAWSERTITVESALGVENSIAGPASAAAASEVWRI